MTERKKLSSGDKAIKLEPRVSTKRRKWEKDKKISFEFSSIQFNKLANKHMHCSRLGIGRYYI